MTRDKEKTRRHFLGQCIAGASATLATGAVAAANNDSIKTDKRPNILFVLTDNQSWLHCGIMGDPIAQTPAFDRIAQTGMLFHQAYVASPSCTPSRSSILTGQDMWRLEEAGLLHGGFPAKFPVYTDLLREAGYHVGYTGKGWGPGVWDRHGRNTDPVGATYNARSLSGAPSAISRTDYASNFEVFLEDRTDGQPFCFWFGAFEPHRPYPEGMGRAQGKRLEEAPLPAFLPDTETIRSDLLDYYVEIGWQDRHLQRMLDHLEALGELDNTLIVATSDNGIQVPRGIANLYDYGTRVPLAICWGDRLRGGRDTGAFVNLIDLAPTFLEAAGVAVPEAMTGRSLLPLLTGDQDESERDFVVTGLERHTLCRPGELPYPMRAIRTNEYLYIRNYESERWPAGAPDYPAPAQGYFGDVDRSPTKTWMLENADAPEVRDLFALCFGKRPAEELYYTPTDPDQIRNLAEAPEHAKARQALEERLNTYLRKTDDPRIAGNAPWDAYPYHSIEVLRFRGEFTNPHVLPKRP